MRYAINGRMLLDSLRSVLPCIGQDDDRPNITNVSVRLGKRLETAATNGHILARFRGETAPGEDASFRLSEVDARYLVSVIVNEIEVWEECEECGEEKLHPHEDVDLLLSVSARAISLYHRKTLLATVKTQSEDFPPYETVIPQPRDRVTLKPAYVVLQPKYLRVVADCFEAFGLNTCALEPGPGLDPVVWSLRDGGRELTVVLMPMRLDVGTPRDGTGKGA